MLDHAAPDHAANPLDAHRHRMRHSAAHVMADAVLQLFPEAKIAIGPPTADGFYYDFEVARPFTPEDLERIEALMRATIRADVPFVRAELSRDEANGMFADQPFKKEIIADLPADATLSIYKHGDFTDLCQGPHVATAGEIAAVKLLHTAGALLARRRKPPHAPAHLRRRLRVPGSAGPPPGAAGRGGTPRPSRPGAAAEPVHRPTRKSAPDSSCGTPKAVSYGR